MSRSGVNIIIPRKLMQRGQFLSWPYAQKHRLLADLEVSAIVNLWSKVDPDLSSIAEGRIYLMWHCSPSRVPDLANEIVRMLVALLRGGHVLLIHCEAGRGRSVWLTTRVLAEYEGLSRAAAYERVKIAIPNHNLTTALEADLL